MARSRVSAGVGLALVCSIVSSACREAAAPEAERGVDLENKVVRIGLLNETSGPAAPLGRAIGLGFRIYYAQVNQEGAGGLPAGWTVEAVERDHGYNPQQSVQLYNEIRDDVLFIGMSFGSPTTVPLHPMLERDRMPAIAVSLSSRAAANEFTPVITPTYRTEAMRAVDWAVEQAGAGVRLGIVYQQDDYGEDALDGFELEADFHGAPVVSRIAVAPGQADFTAVVSELRAGGAGHVLVCALPSATGPLLGTAAQLGFKPTWMACSPSWLDRFFDPDVIPPEVFETYHWVGSAPFWGEENWPGMDRLLEGYERFGRAEMEPDWYILAGYLWAAFGVEVFRRALASGDVTPDGLLRAIHSIDGWAVAGLTKPISMASVPYDASRLVRVARPLMGERSWVEVSPYAVPLSDQADRSTGGR